MFVVDGLSIYIHVKYIQPLTHLYLLMIQSVYTVSMNYTTFDIKFTEICLALNI